jgi:hypothetical protein
MFYKERKKKAMKVSSHVQEHRRDSVLPRHSQQRFRLWSEAGSFRKVFHYFTVHFNSLYKMVQRKHLFVIKH